MRNIPKPIVYLAVTAAFLALAGVSLFPIWAH